MHGRSPDPSAGKTIPACLSAEQVQRNRGWFANAHRARQLLAELETLSLSIAEHKRGLNPSTEDAQPG